MTDSIRQLMHPYPWQQDIWQRLRGQALDGRLAHAILFAGTEGVGKRNLAMALGQFLLCLSPGNQSQGNSGACGTCKACELNRSKSHPDLVRLRPEEGSRVIKIDQVRGLTDFVAKTPQQGVRKVAILEPAEALNINAANALLKCLEEPSGDTFLLLVSHQPASLLATIRSRCQVQPCPLPTPEMVQPWLEQRIAGQDLTELLAAAGGAPLLALALLEGERLQHRKALMKGLLAVANERRSPLQLASELSSGDPAHCVDDMMRWLQNSERGRATDSEVRPGDLDYLLNRIPARLVHRYWDRLVKVKRQLMSNSNPNKQLLLEELLLDWQALAARVE